MKPPFHVTNLQTVITDLVQRHGVQDRLELTCAGQTLLVETIRPRVIRLATFVQTEDGYPVLEREVLFFLDAEGRWIPYQTRYLTTRTYALPTADEDLLLLDWDNQMALAIYCENWDIALQDWANSPDQQALWPEPTDEEPDEEPFVFCIDDEESEATNGG